VKACSTCDQVKPLSDFKKDPRCLDGTKNQCKSCVNVRRRQTRKRDPEKDRADALWHKYRLRQEDYDEIYNFQKGCCAICDTHESEAPRQRLAVDHDHQTGEVRGLLCDFCNTALGKFKDDTALLQEAINYLRSGV